MAKDGKEWLRMGAREVETLRQMGLPTNGREVVIEVEADELDGGFRTVAFRAGSLLLKVFLDVRYECDGAFKFTNESKKKLGLRVE